MVGTELHWTVTKYGKLMTEDKIMDPRGKYITVKVYYYDSEYYVELWHNDCVVLSFKQLYRW